MSKPKTPEKCDCKGVPHYLLEVADGTVCSICFRDLSQADVKKRIQESERRTAQKARGK